MHFSVTNYQLPMPLPQVHDPLRVKRPQGLWRATILAPATPSEYPLTRSPVDYRHWFHPFGSHILSAVLSRRLTQVFLFSHRIGHRDQSEELGREILRRRDPEKMHVIARGNG